MKMGWATPLTQQVRLRRRMLGRSGFTRTEIIHTVRWPRTFLHRIRRYMAGRRGWIS